MENPWTKNLGELRRDAFPPAPVPQPKDGYLVALDSAFAQFKKQHPDFTPTEQNVRQLVSRLDVRRPPTMEDFRNAHALSLYERRYVDAAPTVAKETDPQKMTMDELRNAALDIPEPPREQTMKLSELRAEVFGADQIAEEWKMPLSDLSQKINSGGAS